MTKTVEQLMGKYRIGDSLNNHELMILAERTGQAANALFDLGDVFILAAKEANDIFMECCNYAHARSLIDIPKYDVSKITLWLARNQQNNT